MKYLSIILISLIISCSPGSAKNEEQYNIPGLNFYLTVDQKYNVYESVTAGSLHGYIILLDSGVTCNSLPSEIKRYIIVVAHYNSDESPNLSSDLKDVCDNYVPYEWVSLKNKYIPFRSSCKFQQGEKYLAIIPFAYVIDEDCFRK